MNALDSSRGELRGKVIVKIMLYQAGPTIIQVGRSKELKHVPPPAELMAALERYAKKVVGRRKMKRKAKAKAKASSK